MGARFCLGTAALLLCLSIPERAPAQNTFLTAQWGGLAAPSNAPTFFVNTEFNRFTVLGKPSDPNGTLPYNAIEKSAGFNFLVMGLTIEPFTAEEVAGATLRSLISSTLYFGYTRENPTKYIQNEVIHRLMKLEAVPADEARTAAELATSVDITVWVGDHVFLGSGAATSSIYNEGYFYTGVRQIQLPLPLIRPEFSALVRGGVAIGGDAFALETVAATGYTLLEGSARIPIQSWKGFLPSVELGRTWSSGLFVDGAERPIHETFGTLRLDYKIGSVTVFFETWNDTVGGKDKGPTGGARLSLAVPSPFRAIRTAGL